MPKKKTGARKKAEKQKLRQKDIRSGEKYRNITEMACNFVMVSFGSSSVSKEITLLIIEDKSLFHIKKNLEQILTYICPLCF